MSGLQEGTLFAGRYRIVRSIAAGGMGAVYEVVHIETDRRRALKVMHPHILQSEAMHQRFKLEAKVAAHIESDYIVDVFDAGVDQATAMPFLVMELLRGEDLKARLKRLGRLPPEEVVHHLYQAALALDRTHKASIVHRDLKPDNLFLAEREDSPPRIKVLDFGVAKVIAESAALGPTQSVGTPVYMAPEQFNTHLALTAACDIYALGMIAYTLLVGAPYWIDEAREGNIYILTAAAVHGPQQPASLRAAAQEVALPPPFDAWFATTCAPRAEHRYPSASIAVRALAEVFGIPLPSAGRGSLVSEPSLSAAVNSSPAATRAALGVSAQLAPPADVPETTGLSTAMTRPRAPSKSRGLALAGALGLLALTGGASVAYLTRNEGSPPVRENAAQPSPSAAPPVAETATPIVAPTQTARAPEPTVAPVAHPAPTVLPPPDNARAVLPRSSAAASLPAPPTSQAARSALLKPPPPPPRPPSSPSDASAKPPPPAPKYSFD